MLNLALHKVTGRLSNVKVGTHRYKPTAFSPSQKGAVLTRIRNNEMERMGSLSEIMCVH